MLGELHGFNLGCRIVLSYTYSQEENTQLVTHTHARYLSQLCLRKGIVQCPLFIQRKIDFEGPPHHCKSLVGPKKLLYIHHENNAHFHFKKRRKQKGRLPNWIQKGQECIGFCLINTKMHYPLNLQKKCMPKEQTRTQVHQMHINKSFLQNPPPSLLSLSLSLSQTSQIKNFLCYSFFFNDLEQLKNDFAQHYQGANMLENQMWRFKIYMGIGFFFFLFSKRKNIINS